MNRIKELRKTHGLNQGKLALLLSSSRSNVSKYENGKLALTETLIRQLVEIFDVSADYLLGISDIRDPSASQEDIMKIALFGDREIDETVVAIVKNFAAFTKQEEEKKKSN